MGEKRANFPLASGATLRPGRCLPGERRISLEHPPWRFTSAANGIATSLLQWLDRLDLDGYPLKQAGRKKGRSLGVSTDVGVGIVDGGG
jgi:hypothetical protein